MIIKSIYPSTLGYELGGGGYPGTGRGRVPGVGVGWGCSGCDVSVACGAIFGQLGPGGLSCPKCDHANGTYIHYGCGGVGAGGR